MSCKECIMPVTIELVSQLLSSGGIRHHVDTDEQTIRVVFVTRRYLSPRSEHLAILRVEAAEGGSLCRVVLERAFGGGSSTAATCLAICEAIADVPLVRVEHDFQSRSLRLVAELPVEDGTITPRQLFAQLDAVVEAAEAGQAAVVAIGRDDAACREAA
jgi:hypothetical protein